MSALISIITPTYNHENYIAECIESVLAQTYANWEMLIIDDGSTDTTAQIVKAFASKDSRIKYFHQSNKGLYKLHESYNTLLALSQGQYMAILEGDDYWLPQKLEIQLKEIEATNSIFSWGFAEARDDKKKYLEKYPINYAPHKTDIYNNIKPAYILNMMFEDFPVPLTWLIKKEVLVKMGGFVQSKTAPMLDRDTIFELSLHGRFVFIPEILGIYRRQINQATGKHMLEISRACGTVYETFCNKLPSEIRKNVLFSDKEIQTLNNNNMLIAFSRFGRYLLRKKDYSGAITHYQKSVFHKGSSDMFLWRIRSLTGICFAFLRLDLEKFTDFLGKKSYK